MEPTDRKPKKRRRIGKKYTVEVEVTYIPLPPEKEAAYEYSMHMLGKSKMLLDIANRARRAQREQQSNAEVPKQEDEAQAASSTSDHEKGEVE